MKKDLLCLLDLEPQDFVTLFERALSLKARYQKGIFDSLLAGKTLGLIFDKKSTRTRIAFETAMIQMGGHSIYMSTQDTQISRNEPAKDTARVLSRYIDCLAMRTFDHALVEEFAQSSTIPVINALTDAFHPCQILSDIMTVIEHKGGYENVRIAWVGDGNNVANSWVNAAVVLGLDLIVACPDSHHIKPDIIAASGADTKKNIVFTNDPKEAVKGADVVYTDVWASMGEEDQLEGRLKTFEGFQVNEKLLKGAKDDCLVLHCLPAHRGEEISESVFEAQNAAFWDQAENKRHMHKAILERLILS
ncbi:ornithine carbamoyltransferase [Desulfobacter hydrogenophilus]|uniref:Ornithine carbamoyltransferase n=1 Tax=Desulfobacter hydrogenophilus TaxID=2291 RepID=A0A328FLA7_9BACT|nr:ornithine carbamoyltransferase [Desulfobacter hydrogenophilus]NDY71807.1 ornithine carbamoyltransferase [Desulfobacter hydrogenophilus]QBH13504.1 ornithine carbamoyltransferase [Desulfobacter hydrogenophilus]RAM03755.1 ornithine carbamoyltransferase [Desulfobacter hydrogenophilus]